MSLLCPQCQAQVDDGFAAEGPIVCPVCGSTFQTSTEETLNWPANERPRVFDHFILLEQIGGGAFGTVHRARDLRLNRVVAIKIPRAGLLTNPEEKERFLREARSVARLRHRAIVPLFDVGEHDGCPYLVSDFVEGLNLSDLLTARKFSPREAAVLILEVAEALEYAHRNGVVHRDVKPSNIVIADDGKPHLLDFGLAKIDAGEPSMTTEGQILGTPSYMSPEAARGEAHRADGRSDVYSLGVVLYLLLTGMLPFKGNARVIIHQILHDEPASPRSVNVRIPRDLETICLKSMSKESAYRYSSAEKLAADLRRFLNYEAIEARPPGWKDRLRIWTRRRPAAAAATAVGLTSLVILLALAIIGREQFLENDARILVDRLETAEIGSLPRIILELDAKGRRADRLLEQRLRTVSLNSPPRRRLVLARLADDPSLAGEAVNWAIRAEPAEIAVIRGQIRQRPWSGTGRVRAIFADANQAPRVRLRAAALLATLDPDDRAWAAHRAELVRWLTTTERATVSEWAELFRPVRNQLVGPIRTRFLASSNPEERSTLLYLIASYVDDPRRLVEVVMDTPPAESGALWNKLRAIGPPALAALHREIEIKSADPKGDPDGRRRAGLAIALLALDDREAIRPFLKRDTDPQLRYRLIRSLHLTGITPGNFARWLEEERAERDGAIRAALVLATGQSPLLVLSDSQADPLAAAVMELYRDDPDREVHAAAGWALRRSGRLAELSRLDAEIRQADLAHRPAPGRPDRQWEINAIGQTMIVMRGPVYLAMGSPEDEPGRQTDETRHRVRIGRRFAISSTETRYDQFLKSGMRNKQEGEANRSPDCPVNSISWLDAAMFCNWLSGLEKIDEDQWCYPRSEGLDAEHFKPFPDYLKRTGYRLPTEAEWEYACRAGSGFAQPFGRSEEFLNAFAWNRENSDGHSHPVGMLMPNAFGFFDMLGNLAEWCNDSYGPYPETPDEGFVDDRGVIVMGENIFQVQRGGSYFSGPSMLRSASRARFLAQQPLFFWGFRVARTLPDQPDTEND